MVCVREWLSGTAGGLIARMKKWTNDIRISATAMFSQRKLREIADVLLKGLQTYLGYPLLMASTMAAILVAVHELVVALGNAWVLAKGGWGCALACRRCRGFLRGSYWISCVRVCMRGAGGDWTGMLKSGFGVSLMWLGCAVSAMMVTAVLQFLEHGQSFKEYREYTAVKTGIQIVGRFWDVMTYSSNLICYCIMGNKGVLGLRNFKVTAPLCSRAYTYRMCHACLYSC